MSTERRLAVLRAIVEDYVHTKTPVGSKALGERHNLGVSPATIRNDMAALEEEGLIAQPHTSAGRVPTDAGYRLFVDRIASVKPLSAAERRAITTLISEPVDLDAVLEQTVRVLARLTNQMAIVQYPSVSGDTLRHVDLVPLAGDRLLIVLITDTGRVEQRPVLCPEPLTPDAVATLRERLLNSCVSHPTRDIVSRLDDVAGTYPQANRAALAPVLATIADALSDHITDRVVMAGTANLTRSAPTPEAIAPILEMLEEHVVLLQLVSNMHADPGTGVSVSIGAENEHTGLAQSSVVAATYGPAQGDPAGQGQSRLAVIGPTRMDYPTTIAAVRAVAQYVSRIITPPTAP